MEGMRKERYSLECVLDNLSRRLVVRVRDLLLVRVFQNQYNKNALIECGFHHEQTLAEIGQIIESAMNTNICEIGFVPGYNGTQGRLESGSNEHLEIRYEYSKGDDMLIRIKESLYSGLVYTLRLTEMGMAQAIESPEQIRVTSMSPIGDNSTINGNDHMGNTIEIVYMTPQQQTAQAPQLDILEEYQKDLLDLECCHYYTCNISCMVSCFSWLTCWIGSCTFIKAIGEWHLPSLRCMQCCIGFYSFFSSLLLLAHVGCFGIMIVIILSFSPGFLEVLIITITGIIGILLLGGCLWFMISSCRFTQKVIERVEEVNKQCGIESPDSYSCTLKCPDNWHYLL